MAPDREKVIELLQACLDDWPYAAVRVCTIMNRIKDALALLKEQPVIVRCKDCKHGHKCLNGRREPMVKCELMFDEWLNDFDWFCADGEVR